ncbi:MAG TPA: hypothetical protein VL287_02280 [Gemmatimonadales bacterium]|nr:hypothetical protein [Gemmatimonadales bacterium]
MLAPQGPGWLAKCTPRSARGASGVSLLLDYFSGSASAETREVAASFGVEAIVMRGLKS